MNEEVIQAKELISLIVSTKPAAEVENDEDLYPTPQGEIVVNGDGRCTLVVHPNLGNSLDMGNFRIEVGGVEITVSREVEGPGDDYEFTGREIAYGDGLSEDDVIAAVKENVNFPEYDETEYSGCDFDPDEVEESITIQEGDVYAENEDGDIYRYANAEDIPEDQTIIEPEDAVHTLVEAWSDSSGASDGAFIDSFGPWC